MYVKTNSCYNERGPGTNYVRFSIPHCICLNFYVTPSKGYSFVLVFETYVFHLQTKHVLFYPRWKIENTEVGTLILTFLNEYSPTVFTYLFQCLQIKVRRFLLGHCLKDFLTNVREQSLYVCFHVSIKEYAGF